MDDSENDQYTLPASVDIVPKAAATNKPVDLDGRVVTAAWSRNVDTFYHVSHSAAGQNIAFVSFLYIH